jgi:RNA polymerase sigma-70 factor (ECF subfamily)
MASLASGWVMAREDKAARFEQLFLAEYGKVTAVAYRVLGDSHEAEDVAQEVFCSFYRQHAPDASYAPAWLSRAAVHTALNVVRGKRRRERRETQEAVERERGQVLARASLDPQQALEDAERRRDVRRALGCLSDKSAAVLALRYSGLSYSEVAAVLGVNIGQVGTLLRRAEAALRKELTRGTSH